MCTDALMKGNCPPAGKIILYFTMTNQPKKVAKTGAEQARAYRERIKANKEKYDVYKAQEGEEKE